ncbi:CBS domain-containing protein, partial [Pleurocapsales cyanobacterium LEGE 10410]|nr:CBS domain-containing protein [Pleurocapsales cyanobacterium LEGE 10410]
MQQNNSVSLEQAIEAEPLAVSPETPLEEVIKLMSRNWATSCVLAVGDSRDTPRLPTQFQHSCVLAIANSAVVGILTEKDVVQ